MKHKLLNKLWLRVGMIVAVMTTALAGTAWAESYEELFTISAGSVVSGTSYKAHTATVGGRDFIITFGGNNSSVGTNSGNRSKCTLSSYSKYAVSPVTTSSIASAFACATSLSDVSKISYTFNGGSNQTYTNVYLLYSSDNETFSQISLISGTQGAAISSGSEYTFDAKTGYFALLFEATNNSGNWRIDQVFVKFYKSGSAVATTTTIDASGITNTDLYDGTAAGSLSATVTANGSAVSGATVTWESSDEDVATIAADGTITLVAAGTTTITASYAGVTGQYIGSSATYTLNVSNSAPFTGGDVTFDATKDKGTSPLTKNGVTFTCDNGVLNNGTEYRLYKNSTTTFSTSEGTITSIVFTGVSGYTASGFGTQTGWTTDGNNGTWTGNATSVSFTASGAQVRATQIIVTVDLSATPDPVITANDVNIAYDATSDEIAYTLENATGNVSATVTTGSDWLTLGSITASSVPFTCEANTGVERTATVTLSFSGATDKVVTITQAAAPVIYTTIPELFAAATSAGSTVNVTFGNWVVSGVSGSNVFVTDNNGNGFIIYKSGHGFVVNDKLSGTVMGTPLKLYNGSAEFTNLTASTDGLSVSNDGVITVITNNSIADLGGVNTGAVITLSNLTYDGTNLSDGTNTIKPYNTLYDAMSFTNGKTYNVTGVYQQYNSTKEILPRSAADIEEVADEREEAGIAFSVEELTITQGDEFTAPTFSNPNNVTVSFATTNSNVASWNNGLVLGGSTGTATITATFDGDDDYKPATATLVVTVNEDLDFATVVVGSNVYQKITSTSDLEAGKRYLVVYENTDNLEESKVMNGVNNSNMYAGVATAAISDSKINNFALAATPIVLQNAGSSSWYLIENDKFLYVSTDGNYLNSSENSSTNGTTWTISFVEDVMKINNNYLTERYLMYNSNQPRFTTYKNTQKNVVLYKELPITLNASGYATFASTSAIDFSDDSEFSAWAITSANKTTGVINFSQITGAVPAGTGVLLKGTAYQTIYPVLATTSATAPAGNLLVGFTEATAVESDQYYGLKGDTFKKVNAGTVPAGKALLPASQVGTDVKAFTFNFEDAATGIEKLNADVKLNEGAIYNLVGQRLGKMQKGINIVNGKKVLK